MNDDQIKAVALALDDPSPIVRKSAAEELAKAGRLTKSILEEALFAEGPERKRRAAAYALALMGADSMAILVKALESQSEAIQETGAYALARIGETAIDTVATCLASMDPQVRRYAALSLGRHTSEGSGRQQTEGEGTAAWI
jgi:HEAT repeat protein